MDSIQAGIEKKSISFMIESSRNNRSLEKSKPFSDGIALLAWVLLNGYNVWNTCYYGGGLTAKYFFQLTHITSFFIGVLFLISFIFKCCQKKDIASSIFSNTISFTLGLSVVTDTMFWLFVYTPTTSVVDLTDVILMHGVITVVLVAWMLWKAQVPFHHGYTPFSKTTKTVFWALLPIGLITFGYMAWTAIGQTILNKPIYQNVIDWNHIGLTLTTFGRAAFGFLVLTAVYWGIAKVSSLCSCGKNARIQPKMDDIDQPLLSDDDNPNICNAEDASFSAKK